ncbi:RNA polymerase sigma factor [Sphingobacterium sp. JUb20]|uniref:RNA polymerase sigma factor n=2 Tax=unclassified Sphingobacterium TaxID=2609468 RepID=UPI0010495107|nr:sigma-70 family RNA polymerase sigma factor [Sphingobacterium sp. JUb20]TCQ98905.1 RNA polymerase sigma-70 factor (ECF subfamily) [Sphingobacterium sp. JUb20]
MFEKKVYEDHELISLLKSGEESAITLIYEKFWKRLFLSAYSILKEKDQAQDIVQEVLLQLWIRRDKVEIEKLGAYLQTATRYKVLTYIRSADSRKVFIDDQDLELLAGVEQLNDKLHVNDINILLEKEVLSLPERCRQVFILSRHEFLTNKEIAERLGITVKAVESQITIALRRIRGTLSDFFLLIIILSALLY